jgi:23S rRNA (adenine2503-C2)-methyltransferase
LEKIEDILKDQPKYRLSQVKKALFFDLISSWDQATTIPKDLREKLKVVYPLPEIKSDKILESGDSQTVKASFSLSDGFKIESVLMEHNDGRKTVCVSSQAGCAMGCQFCATGHSGFSRNLSEDEITAQVMFFARKLKEKTRGEAKVTNIVFMGMGEPFLNYDNVLSAIRVLNDKDGFNLGARHMSVSTCGIAGGIEKFAKEGLQVNLAISLHAPNNDLRDKLMPINKTYPIEKLLSATDDYINQTNRRVMFEYLMIDGINDSEECAEELAKIMNKPLYFVNLISFNPVGHSKFSPSGSFKINRFRDILEKRGVFVTLRYRFGENIKAACGQLAAENDIPE